MTSRTREIGKKLLHSGLPLPAFLRPLIRAGYDGGVWAMESLVLLKKLLWVEPVLRAVCEDVGSALRAERLPYIRGKGRIRLGDRVNLSGRSCFYFIHGMAETPRIEIGDSAFIGNGCTLSAGHLISIGKHCLLSTTVRVHDNDGHPLDPGRRGRGEPIGEDDVAPVTIEDNVWIGAAAIILKGVTIGSNSVVGAGAVVTADVPANTVVAGNPAIVVKSLSIPRSGTSIHK